MYDKWTATGPIGAMLGDSKIRECIRPTAFNGVDTSRVLLLADHNMGRPLARVGAGLTLDNRPDGLYFTASLPDTTEARDMVTLLKSGVLSECSFGYTVASETIEKHDGLVWLAVDQVGALYELSIVSAPAFQGTSALAASRKGRTPAEIRRLVDDVTNTPTTAARSSYLRTLPVSPYGPKSPHSVLGRRRARRPAIRGTMDTRRPGTRLEGRAHRVPRPHQPRLATTPTRHGDASKRPA